MIRKIIIGVILGGLLVLAPILYFVNSFHFTMSQLQALHICGIITLASVLYCFIVGEITNNHSQMDKLWSLLPETYIWVMFFVDLSSTGQVSIRLLVMAILATAWGIRLTINFALKGAYSIKFWSGEEDYRWKLLKKSKIFQARYRWILFDLFFISLYQNVLILLTTFPSLVSIGSNVAFNYIDVIAVVLVTFFLVLETVADLQQWKFQSTKYSLLNESKSLSKLPLPYSLGFNTTGLWNYMRHPNYLGEQGIWLSLYVFSIAATNSFNWSYFGAVLLVLLFLGSSTLSESISKTKYSEYELYTKKVFKYLPFKRFN